MLCRRFALFPALVICCAVPVPLLASQKPAPVRVPTAVLDSYAGQYREQNEPDIVISVFRDGDRLYIESPRTGRVDLTPKSNTTFEPDFNALYTFVIDANGAVTEIRFSMPGSPDSILARISSTPVPNHFRPYSREEAMIPMRDGVKLHAVILRPIDTKESLPFLIQRTPYGVDGYDSDSINSRYTELAQSGYIFVMEDIRGRYKSEGKFVMMRPLAEHGDPNAASAKGATPEVDESTDSYDTVAWLLQHVPHNNGRVGVLGVSYPGFLAAEAGIDPHPAVRAISPQAPMTDVWIGDDFFHNGAFRQTYGYDYVLGMESTKESTFGKLDEDAYTFFLKAGSFAAAGKLEDKISGGSDAVDALPTWRAFIDHPSYDSFWQSRAVQPHLTTIAVPALEVGGWWDQEDLWGPQEEYAVIEPHNQPANPAHRVYMALGPWRHGGWSQTTRVLGDVNFGEPTGDEFRKNIEAPFFAYYLKDQPDPGGSGFNLASVATYQTGSERWMHYNQWPPKTVTTHDLYLDADGSLSFSKPADPNAFKAYTSDPADPVPYRRRPIEATYAPGGSGWYTWLVQDQSFVENRKDVATWETPPLDHDVTVTGNVIADLIASTSGTDSDWVVKLIDVFPDGPAPACHEPCLSIIPGPGVKPAGFELMIADEIFRGRYRSSFSHPEAIPANKPEEYKFSLHAADHVFLTGHRIMVQVQSTWFPLYDRNPQTFVPNIMTAQPSEYKTAEQHIYAGSHIELPMPN